MWGFASDFSRILSTKGVHGHAYLCTLSAGLISDRRHVLRARPYYTGYSTDENVGRVCGRRVFAQRADYTVGSSVRDTPITPYASTRTNNNRSLRHRVDVVSRATTSAPAAPPITRVSYSNDKTAHVHDGFSLFPLT